MEVEQDRHGCSRGHDSVRSRRGLRYRAKQADDRFISMIVRAREPNVNAAVGRTQDQRLVGDSCRTRDGSRNPRFRIPLTRLHCRVVLGAWTRHDRWPSMPLEHATQGPNGSGCCESWHAAERALYAVSRLEFARRSAASSLT